MMIDRAAALMDAARTRQQGAGAVGDGARLAQRRPAGRAWDAVAATRHEHQHHMIAGHDRRHAGADLAHDAGGLVSKCDRHRPRAIAVDHGKV